MFTAGEVESIMRSQKYPPDLAITMDDFISITEVGIRHHLLNPGLKIHALHEPGTYMLTLDIGDGSIRLASEVMDGAQMLPDKGVKGADAVLYVLAFACSTATTLTGRYAKARLK